MIIAIHQPNFFPWLGYFQKISSADTFVFLDAVQIPKKGGSWTNRVRLLVGGKPHWITVPIVRGHGYQNINEVVIDDKYPWRKKLLRSLEVNYGKCEYFHSVMSWIKPMILRPTSSLVEYNIENIKEVARYLDFDCRFIKQSDLSTPAVFEKTGSQRLAAICKELEGAVYLAGDGAYEYEDKSAYEKFGINLARNNFEAKPYPQVGVKELVPGLSIFDALLNAGVEETRRLLDFDLGIEDGAG